VGEQERSYAAMPTDQSMDIDWFIMIRSLNAAG
jgi:hypothetical protein